MTNRDLYKRVRGFQDRFDGNSLPTLEQYLRSLWAIVSLARPIEPDPDRLVAWLEQAFTYDPPAVDPHWTPRDPADSDKPITFADWERLILMQIADLQYFAQNGQLEDEQRYFGIDAPNCWRWYNFDPLTYLECAVRGTMGGYEENEVMILIPPEEGESADSPVWELEAFTWEAFLDFLECGHSYE